MVAILSAGMFVLKSRYSASFCALTTESRQVRQRKSIAKWVDFETDRELFQTEVFIAVIEKDLLFNDVGSTKSNVKINTTSIKPQQFVFEVQVKESRSLLSKLFWG